MTLKERLQSDLKLPEDSFGTHESDLHVKYSKEVNDWLSTNYDHYSNITKFFDATDKRTLWLDIPFGYMNEHFAKKFPKLSGL